MEITSALARRLREMGAARDPILARQFETGEAITHQARKPPANPLAKMAAALSRFAPKRKRRVDPVEAKCKRRKWGGGSAMPDHIRPHYTEGERAALGIIAEQVKLNGYCELAVETIADRAGVSRTTVQNAIRKARSGDHAHIAVQLRPQPGRKNLTNIIRIVSAEWLRWLKRSIGFKTVNPSETKEKNLSLSSKAQPSQRAFEGEKAGSSSFDNYRLNARNDQSQLPSRSAVSARAMHPASRGGGWVESWQT